MEISNEAIIAMVEKANTPDWLVLDVTFCFDEIKVTSAWHYNGKQFGYSLTCSRFDEFLRYILLQNIEDLIHQAKASKKILLRQDFGELGLVKGEIYAKCAKTCGWVA